MKKKGNNIYLSLFFIIITVFVLFLLFKTMSNNKKIEMFTNSEPTYGAKSKYAKVTYSVNGDEITINASFGNLDKVSAVHIHTNDNGKPGAIIAWLATTDEWQSGVIQNTPGKNAPCCSKQNKFCSLAAPNNTPTIKNVMNNSMAYVVSKEFCKKDCPWINKGTFLVVHGYDFQKVINGCISNEKPGIDVIDAIPFTKI